MDSHGGARVLFIADVSKGMMNSSSSTLVLTTESIVVVDSDEDAQEAVHSLHEIECHGCQEDPTKITIKLSNQESNSGLPGIAVKERVAQFVMETGMHCTISDIESDSEVEKRDLEPKTPEVGPETKKEEAVFYASPVAASELLAHFFIAKRQIRHCGFDML